jgi:hypothetical protein
VDLPKVRAEIASAWKTNGLEGVRKAGYEIVAGEKQGIWIVVQNGVELGALDRLVRVKRVAIREAIEAESAQIQKSGRSQRPVQRPSQSEAGDPSREFRSESAKKSSFRKLTSGSEKQAEHVPELKIARDVLERSEARRRRTYYGTLRSERAAKCVLKKPRPRGLWAWLFGRTRRWNREVLDAEAELVRIKKLRDSSRNAVHEAKTELKRLETVHGEVSCMEETKTHLNLSGFAADRRFRRTGKKKVISHPSPTNMSP